jgi:glycosyltransferase involved in cell wall biosynthesis
MTKQKLLYIQPIIARFRLPVVNYLCRHFDLTIYAGQPDRGSGHARTSPQCKVIDAPSTFLFNKTLAYQHKVLSVPLRREVVILTFSNPRYISYWILLLRASVLKIPVYSHGQGLYRKPTPSFLSRVMYRLIVALSRKYICYNELAKNSMLAIGCPPQKLASADNSLEVSTPVTPDQKQYNENGILYLGRLREASNVESLITGIRHLRRTYNDVELHIIGSGILESRLKDFAKDEDWIHWHGAIHEDEKISEISKSCRVGCHPGSAGLSIVHMFGLSLPPLVHDSMPKHQGPEPHYIEDCKNGFLFNHKDRDSLAEKLLSIWSMPQERLREIGQHAYSTYLALNSPSLGERFTRIIEHDLKEGTRE